MNSQSEFYQAHLDNVSRSFALCIQQLKEPLKNRIGLAYLICRILDTVEDSSWTEAQQKLEQMDQFISFVINAPRGESVEKWVSQFPDDITETEKKLILDSYRILSDLHALPTDERKILQETALSMGNGMAYFLKRTAAHNTLILDSLIDVNRYCFFVAGVVGEMLTKLICLGNPEFKLSETNLQRAHQFGLFLQKINLLKDQLDDQKVGRSLVPSHDDLWRSLEADAHGAFDYLAEIPLVEKEYRLFCAWSLFLGLASLPWIRKSWTQRFLEKIPRMIMQKLLTEVTPLIDNNDALRAFFNKMLPDFSASSAVSNATPAHVQFIDFHKLYHGRLSQQHLVKLGLESEGGLTH